MQKLTLMIYNANPKNKKTGDCVIRAIATATGEPYKKIYRELFEISLKTGYMLNDKAVYEKLIQRYGFVKMKQPRKPNGTKYQIGELREIESAQTVIIKCAHHLTAAIGGTLYDLWNCTQKTIGNYYIKNEAPKTTPAPKITKIKL